MLVLKSLNVNGRRQYCKGAFWRRAALPISRSTRTSVSTPPGTLGCQTAPRSGLSSVSVVNDGSSTTTKHQASASTTTFKCSTKGASPTDGSTASITSLTTSCIVSSPAVSPDGTRSPEWELRQRLCRRRMSLTASMLSDGCSVGPGSTSIGAKEVLRRYASIVGNGTITSRTGPRRRSTIGLLMELMHFGPSRAVSTIPRCRNLIGGAGKGNRPRGVHSGRHDLKFRKRCSTMVPLMEQMFSPAVSMTPTRFGLSVASHAAGFT
jgi:hypothetical protein